MESETVSRNNVRTGIMDWMAYYISESEEFKTKMKNEDVSLAMYNLIVGDKK